MGKHHPRIKAQDQYGMLTVLRLIPPGEMHPRYTMCVCRCDCGEETTIPAYSVHRNKSCGCLSRNSRRTHGQTSHGRIPPPIYQMWCGIRQRCDNPKHKSYGYYGERGIKMYPAWAADYEMFYTYVTGQLGPRPRDHGIGLIDVTRDFEPGNIRWTSHGERKLIAQRIASVMTESSPRQARQ